LTTILRKSDTNGGTGRAFYTIHFDALPCSIFTNPEETCFGVNPPSGPGSDQGLFPKGKCDDVPGCCDTIAWGTSSSQACLPDQDIQAPGQCRHQQVCIRARSASLTCQTGCDSCGPHQETLRACATGFESTPVFSLTANRPITIVSTSQPDADGCVTYTVAVPAGTTEFTLVATGGGCSLSTKTSTTAGAVPVLGALTHNTPGCDQAVTITATAPPAGCTTPVYTWSGAVDGDQDAHDRFFTFLPDLGTCYDISVTLNCGNGCVSAPVRQNVHINCEVSFAACQ